jgi:RND family efflux transporter MFP subunit
MTFGENMRMTPLAHLRSNKRSLVFLGALAVLTIVVILIATTGIPGWSGKEAAAQAKADKKDSVATVDGSLENGSAQNGGDANEAENIITVETIRPRPNPKGFVRSVTPPTYVEGFYTADLMARVPGTVKSIRKNIGDTVNEGEVLVELDAPDLIQELAQKKAAVEHATEELKAAQISLSVAQACAKTAHALIKESEAAEEHAADMRAFHEKEYNRYQVLADRDAVVANVLDEKLRDLQAAGADYRTAQAATETAKAKAEEYSTKVDAARVDIDVKRARVAVAAADLDFAQSMVDYTKIRAPFSGLIVSRKVDPGSFVQNASTGNPVPMLRVVRTDLVTFVTWVPEKDAPLVNKDTDATIQLDALGDQVIRRKVTRYSHWLDPEKSRDMRVEVDVENKDGRLAPGMYGLMTLRLEDFSKSRLVPTSAIFAVGDQSYVFEVQGGHAIRVPVRIQYEDGVQAKIVKIVQSTDAKTGKSVEAFQDLTDEDQIVRSGQGELAHGQSVKAVPVDW